jgi:myo-inositol-1(or 4)-monophosphatase
MLYTRELKTLRKAVVEAGQAVLRIAEEEFKMTYKLGMEPVTTADFMANRILQDALIGKFPDYGWLSEETRDDLDRLNKKRVWIVDPIDGTKEFIRGIPEYAVSVALVEDGSPVLGVVYNPSGYELFTAIKGHGAWLNENPIRADYQFSGFPVVLGSRTEVHRGEFEPFLKSAVIRPTGSIAYKLALVAAGRADATFSLGHKNEWDIAAGVLLVKEAGGRVGDRDGYPLVFNRKRTLVNGVVAATSKAYPYVMNMINRLHNSDMKNAAM